MPTIVLMLKNNISYARIVPRCNI